MQTMLLFLIGCSFHISAHLSATINISDNPISTIRGKDALLDKPEGIAFSSTGTLLAVANSNNASVALYRVAANGTCEKTPVQLLNNAQLKHPSGVAFSPDGFTLAVANRDSNQVALFQNKNSSFSFQNILTENELNMPASVSYQPQGRMLAVANRTGKSAISIYAISNTSCKAASTQLPATVLKPLELSTPHSLAFSPDGTSLAAIHKKVCKYVPGKSALTVWDTERMIPTYVSLQEYEPLHSVSFHPSNKYIAVSNEKKGIMIFERRGSSFELTTTLRLSEHGNQVSPKGIAFSPCGRFIACSTTEPSLLMYSIQVQN